MSEIENALHNGTIFQDEHGAYHWSSYIDRDYEKKTFKIAFAAVGGSCAPFLIMSLVLGDGMMLRIVLLTCVGAFAITGGVCWLFNRRAGKRVQRYILTEDSIQFVRRYNVPFTFRSIKRAAVYEARDMIELFQQMGSGPIFVAHEDFPFVKDYILQRLPDTAEIAYR